MSQTTFLLFRTQEREREKMKGQYRLYTLIKYFLIGSPAFLNEHYSGHLQFQFSAISRKFCVTMLLFLHIRDVKSRCSGQDMFFDERKAKLIVQGVERVGWMNLAKKIKSRNRSNLNPQCARGDGVFSSCPSFCEFDCAFDQGS